MRRRSLYLVAGVSLAMVMGAACSTQDSTDKSSILPPEKIQSSFAPGDNILQNEMASTREEEFSNDEYIDYDYDYDYSYTVEFSASDSIGPLPQDNIAYHYPNEPAVDKADVERLAETFGVVGEVESGEFGYVWQVGPDPSGRTITVNSDALASWSMWSDRPFSPDSPNITTAFGILQYAGGYFARPVEKGPYPLIDLDAAVRRLQDVWTGSGYYRSDTAISSDGVTPPGTSDPSPSPGGPDERVVEVVLVSVEAGNYQIWADDGSVWLVPSYKFTGDDGQTYEVPAITDEFMPSSIFSDDMFEGDPYHGDPSMGEPLVTVEDAEILIGLDDKDAMKVAEDNGWDLRPVRIDGEDMMITSDYSSSRVNVTFESGVVVSIDYIG